MDIFEMIMQAAAQHIFPIVVCAFLLWERHKTTKEMNETLNTFSNNLMENTTLLKALVSLIRKEQDKHDQF